MPIACLPVIDPTKVLFTSELAIDKVLATGTQTYQVQSSFGSSDQYSVVESIPNPASVKGFINASFSIDGQNFYDQSESVSYFSNFDMLEFIGFQIYTGSNEQNIYFALYNNFADGSGNGIMQTVTINWALYSTT